MAIEALQNNTEIIILPVNKGNATVVMDKFEYSKKLSNLFRDGSYSKIKKDLTL